MNVKNNVAVFAILIFSALTRNATGVIQLGGTITNSGDLIYNDAVVLTNNTTLVSTGSGTILFYSTVNGGYSLTVNTAGTTVFGGAVGGVTALSSLTTDAGGTTQIGASMMKTTGSQTYNDAVVLGMDVALTSTGAGGISINSTVNGEYSLAVNTAGTTVFGGLVSVDSLTTDAAGTTQIHGSVMATTGNQTYHDAVVLWADVAFSSTGSGDIAFNSTVNGWYSLVVNTAGVTVFNGVVGATDALSSLATDAAGTTIIGCGAITTIGAQAYLDAVVLGADVELTSAGSGDIAFVSTVNGGYSLEINAGGDTVFNGVVGGVTPLSSLTANAVGGITINGSSIVTTGAQTYNDALVLGVNVAFTSTGFGDVTFNSTVNGGNSLTVNTAGDTVFNGVVGGVTPLYSLTTDAAGTTIINCSAITTTRTQTYNDAVALAHGTTLTSTSLTGNVVFASTVNGAYSLAIDSAHATVFSGTVGGVTPLSSLTMDAGGGININCSTISTTGSQAYNDAVVLAADLELTSAGSGDIAFNSTVNGGYSLAVDTAGTTVFNGAVGGVNALSSLAIAGAAQIHGEITTTGDQIYNNHVTLAGNTTLTAAQVGFSVSAAASGSVTIAAALNNSGFIAVNGGTLSFMGVVTNSATIRANNGSVLNFGATVYNGGVIDALAGRAILGGALFNSGTFVEASSFLTTEIRKVGNDIRLAWSTMGGHEYVLQAGAPSSGGGYTNNFSDISPVMAIAGQSLGATNYLHVGGATNLHSRYYRIRLQL